MTTALSTMLAVQAKAIETRYNGYRFRSRLEARWAVFFDKLGIEYRYELEGYDLNGLWYLPDFYLPKWKRWVEIKPTVPTSKECEKAIRLCIATQQRVVILAGDIWDEQYMGFDFFPMTTYYRLVIPMILDSISHLSLDDHLSALHGKHSLILSDTWKEFWIAADFDKGFVCLPCAFLRCPKCNLISLSTDDHCINGLEELFTFKGDVFTSSLMELAYTSARSARFEHGERP